MANVHYLKTWKPYFKDAKSGAKNFQARKNDRNYEVGDTLILEEFDQDKGVYTGNWTPKLITYKLDDPNFVKEGFVILGIKDIVV